MRSGFNAVGSVLVRPFNRSGFAIVGADIAHDFAVQIFDRSKDAAGNEVALDLGEPDFDLIEPRRIGWRVMNAYLRVTSQKIADRPGFVCAQVIADDVNGLFWSLAGDEIFQKGDELCTGVAGARLANHLAAGGMERRVQRERAVAVILEAVSFGPARGEWQNWVQTIQRLDGTLFVDAEDRRVQRWLEVKSNDVSQEAID